MITFVCCVESGALESQAVRMVQSLRYYGGIFANAPLVAVTPRFGPPLLTETIRTFLRLNVTYIRAGENKQYSWFKFLNKPLALAAAEKIIDSDIVGFLDSDVIFVGEPDKLSLLPSEDFLAFPVESKEMGSTGPGDPFDPIWHEFCRITGVNINDLPWVQTVQTNERVRLYFNSGIFVYRRATGFAKSYLDICLKLLDSRISSRAEGYGEGLKEMIGLGLSAIKLGLRWRALPYSHNYVMLSKIHEEWYTEEALSNAKIVHYHDCMWMPFFPTFSECLQATHPEVGAWLATLGPMRNESPVHWRILSRALKAARAKQEAAYLRDCRIA